MEEFEKSEQIQEFPKITAGDIASAEEYRKWEDEQLEKMEEKGEKGKKIEFPVYELPESDPRVVYFGSHHTNDPDDPILGKIREKFEKANPDIVFVEGNRRLQINKEEELKYHDRVFIVYGGSHAVMQRPAIKKLLGIKAVEENRVN